MNSMLTEQAEHDWEQEILNMPEDDGNWGPDGMPEPPPGYFPTNAEEEESLILETIQLALENPSWGEPYAA